MTNPSKRRGDSAELEAARILEQHLGWTVRRKLGAGRADDTGDLYVTEHPEIVVQVKNWPSRTLASFHAARDDADEQARNNHSPFRFGMVRTRGGVWTCVTSVEAQAVWIREAL